MLTCVAERHAWFILFIVMNESVLRFPLSHALCGLDGALGVLHLDQKPNAYVFATMGAALTR